MMAVGPLAELAINRVIMQGLREQLADAQAIADRRAREAFEEWMQRGRATRPLAFWIGVGVTLMVGAPVVAWIL